jgi:hypothetical protein
MEFSGAQSEETLHSVCIQCPGCPWWVTGPNRTVTILLAIGELKGLPF